MRIQNEIKLQVVYRNKIIRQNEWLKNNFHSWQHLKSSFCSPQVTKTLCFLTFFSATFPRMKFSKRSMQTYHPKFVERGLFTPITQVRNPLGILNIYSHTRRYIFIQTGEKNYSNCPKSISGEIWVMKTPVVIQLRLFSNLAFVVELHVGIYTTAINKKSTVKFWDGEGPEAFRLRES